MTHRWLNKAVYVERMCAAVRATSVVQLSDCCTYSCRCVESLLCNRVMGQQRRQSQRELKQVRRKNEMEIVVEEYEMLQPKVDVNQIE